MKSLNYLLSAVCAFCLINFSCNKEDDKDTRKPSFDNTNATPQDGSKFLRGDTIVFLQIFNDNEELGSFNIEIHNNFDHHSHSTESLSKHSSDGGGDIENAWVFNQDYEIPDGNKTFTADFKIPIPSDIAEGDYHFMIRVTDKAGWQEIKAVEIEIED